MCGPRLCDRSRAGYQGPVAGSQAPVRTPPICGRPCRDYLTTTLPPAGPLFAEDAQRLLGILLRLLAVTQAFVHGPKFVERSSLPRFFPPLARNVRCFVPANPR